MVLTSPRSFPSNRYCDEPFKDIIENERLSEDFAADIMKQFNIPSVSTSSDKIFLLQVTRLRASKTYEFTVQDENGGERTELVEPPEMGEGENPNQLNQHSSLENPNTQEEYEAMERRNPRSRQS